MTSVFIKLLNMSITAGLLIIAVILLRFVFRKIPKRIICIMWALVGIRLVFPFALQSKLSLIPSTDFVPQDIVETNNYPSHYFFESVRYDTGMPANLSGYEVDSTADAANGNANDADNALNIGEPNNESIDTDGNVEDNTVLQDESITANSNAENKYSDNAIENIAPMRNEEYKTEAVNTLIIVITWVWLMGALILLVYAVISYIRLRKKVRINVNLQEKVYICDYVKSPFILGMIKPRVYLPSNIDDTALGYVLAHEKAHLARLDHIWKPLGFLLLAVYWFNPLVWAAYILLCRDIEYACDEKVIADMPLDEKKEYSRILLDYSNKKFVTACPVAFGEIGVKARIKSILDYKRPSFWVIIIAIAVCIAMSVCFLTDPKTKINHPETESNPQADLANQAYSENNNGTNTDCKAVSAYLTDYSMYLSVPSIHLQWNNHADESLRISPDYRLYLLKNGKKEFIAENKFSDESDLMIDKMSDDHTAVKAFDYLFDKEKLQVPYGRYVLEQSFTLDGDSKEYTMSAEFTENSHIWDNVEWIPILSDDFDHDGKNESFKYAKMRIFYNDKNKKYEYSNQEGLYTLAYFDDSGAILQIKETSIFHAEWNSYYLVSQDDKYCFLEYNPAMNTGIGGYYYYLCDMNFKLIEDAEIRFDIDFPERGTSTYNEIKLFASHINGYLKSAKLLLSTLGGELLTGLDTIAYTEGIYGIYTPGYANDKSILQSDEVSFFTENGIFLKRDNTAFFEEEPDYIFQNKSENTNCENISVKLIDFATYLVKPMVKLYWHNGSDYAVKADSEYRLYLLEDGVKKQLGEDLLLRPSSIELNNGRSAYVRYYFDKKLFSKQNYTYILEQDFTLNNSSDERYTMSVEFTANDDLWKDVDWTEIYSGDFNGDGTNESFKYANMSFFLNNDKKTEFKTDNSRGTFAFFDGSGKILYLDKISTDNGGRTSYYLVHINNEYRLLEYKPYVYAGLGRYQYNLYGMDMSLIECDTFCFDANNDQAYKTQDEIDRFAARIKELLSHSTLIMSTYKEMALGPKPAKFTEDIFYGIVVPDN